MHDLQHCQANIMHDLQQYHSNIKHDRQQYQSNITPKLQHCQANITHNLQHCQANIIANGQIFAKKSENKELLSIFHTVNISSIQALYVQEGLAVYYSKQCRPWSGLPYGGEPGY